MATITYSGPANYGALATYTTAATLVAGAPTLIKTGGEAANAIDVWLMSETGSDTCTLVVTEFVGALAVANIRRVYRLPIQATDMTMTVDRVIWGLVTATERAPKEPVRIPYTPGSLLSLSVEAVGTGPFYARYALVDGSSGVTSAGSNTVMGDVGIVNTSNEAVDPSEARAANTAYVAADKLTPVGAVKSATRHTAAELETFADDDWVPVGATATHELRTRDEDANTDLDVLITDAQAANTAYAAADRVTPLGAVKSAARHTAAELETFADDDWVPIGATAVHEMRVRDDDANTDLDTIASDTTAIAEAAGDGLTIVTLALAETGNQQELVAAPDAGHQIWVFRVSGTCTAACTVQFHDDDDAALTGPMSFNANGGLVDSGGNVAVPYLKCSAARALEISVSAGAFNGVMTYADVTL